MPTLRELSESLLADGRIDGREVESLTILLYEDGRISRAEAEFLVQLHRRVERASPAFDRFYHAALKRHVLADGVIGPDAAGWLRQVLPAGRRVTDAERRLLRELRGEATRTCPEFEALFAECVKSVSKPRAGRATATADQPFPGDE